MISHKVYIQYPLDLYPKVNKYLPQEVWLELHGFQGLLIKQRDLKIDKTLVTQNTMFTNKHIKLNVITSNQI